MALAWQRLQKSLGLLLPLVPPSQKVKVQLSYFEEIYSSFCKQILTSVSTKSDALQKVMLTPASYATALARRVLPVPALGKQNRFGV
jgi:hypothetical protein